MSSSEGERPGIGPAVGPNGFANPGACLAFSETRRACSMSRTLASPLTKFAAVPKRPWVTSLPMLATVLPCEVACDPVGVRAR